MARSDFFHRFMRSVRIAETCNVHGWSAREGVERAREDARVRIGRRALLGGAAAASAFAVGCSGGEGNAAPVYGATRSSIAKSNVDVGIVGAGLAGLACANELKRAGVVATIHEASARAGGRCFSMGGAFGGPVMFPGQVIERGGELIDNLHKTMLGYANEFGLELEDYEKLGGDELFYFDGARVPEEVVVDEYRQFVAAMGADLRTIGEPTAEGSTPAEQALDRMSLREYLDTRGAGPMLRQVIDVAYNIEYGVEIERLSALAFLLFIHADKRSRFQPFGIFSDERFHIVSGNESVVRGLAGKLPNQLRFGRELTRVAKRSDGRIELTFKEGSRTTVFVHDEVVITVPFSVLRGVELHASLGIPAWKRLAIDAFQYGTNAKMMVGFKAPFWRDLGSNGAVYTDMLNVQTTWETNPSRATSAHAVLTNFTGGNYGASLDPAKTQTQVAAFLDSLDKVYPGAKANALRSGKNVVAHIEAWPKNPLSKGSYSANAPGYFTTVADNEAKPIGNLHFAGEHTSSFYEWQGFMEGAALSGIRAALEILRG